MNTPPLNTQYWEQRYLDHQVGWDVGHITPPLKAYFDQLKSKELKILIPGAGNAYEAEYLHQQGFTQVYVVDWALQPLENLKQRCPDFPAEHLIQADFFDLAPAYDLIVEQTFFCALEPRLRTAYADKMQELLSRGGKLVGVLFDDPLFEDHPPFGGNKATYLPYFRGKFEIATFERCYNSLPPRANRELFIKLKKQ